MSVGKTIKNKIAVILLAAGESTRLGSPKQLLFHDGQTLLRNSFKVANDSDAGMVIVVLGAGADTIRRDIPDRAINIVINAEWQEGMGSSIRCGINTLLGIDPLAEGAILMVCDQPFVTSALLNNLITTHKMAGKPVVACSYENTFGPPVFFHKTLFPELMQLRGDIGARGVIRQHLEDVELIPFPKGSIDIDTPADYQKLSNPTID